MSLNLPPRCSSKYLPFSRPVEFTPLNNKISNDQIQNFLELRYIVNHSKSAPWDDRKNPWQRYLFNNKLLAQDVFHKIDDPETKLYYEQTGKKAKTTKGQRRETNQTFDVHPVQQAILARLKKLPG